MIVISCITLLSIKATNNNDINDKSRFIIKSTEKAYIAASKEKGSNGGIRASSSSQSGNSEVQLLPIPDTSSHIIITPLSPEKL